MLSEDEVKEKVRSCYWDLDINCATTCLKILSEDFSLKLEPQTLDAAVAMHGAGGFRAQCGLVEGTLMFAGIKGRELKLTDDKIASIVRDYAENFEIEFGSLMCRVLRPQGFSNDQPPHMCHDLSVRALIFNIKEMKKVFSI